jgi:hypothetical protein
MTHLREALLADFLESLSTADAGALLHLLVCPECAAKALTALAFQPTERSSSDAGKSPPGAEG